MNSYGWFLFAEQKPSSKKYTIVCLKVIDCRNERCYTLGGGMNMQNSVLTHKTLLFAARIIKLRKHLNKKFKEFDLAKQIGKSGASIGANVNEANYAQSKADFVSKMQIALKETAETEYWIRLLRLTNYITPTEEESLLADCIEIKKLLVSTVNTAKQD